MAQDPLAAAPPSQPAALSPTSFLTEFLTQLAPNSLVGLLDPSGATTIELTHTAGHRPLALCFSALAPGPPFPCPTLITSALALPLHPATVDALWCTALPPSFPDALRYLTELYRVVRRSGIIALSLPHSIDHSELRTTLLKASWTPLHLGLDSDLLWATALR